MNSPGATTSSPNGTVEQPVQEVAGERGGEQRARDRPQQNISVNAPMMPGKLPVVPNIAG